jgi:hypothetical protein
MTPCGGDVATESRQQLVLRPSQRIRSGRGRSVGTAAWILASLLYSLRFDGSARIVVAVAGVDIAVGVIGVMRLSRRRTKLVMTNGRLIFSGLLRDRVLPSGNGLRRVVKVEVAWRSGSGRRSRLWLLINATGRAVVGLNRETWDEGQLERLRETLRLPLEIDDAPRRPAELRSEYPGSVAWWAVHSAIIVPLAIVIVAVLALILQHLAQ